MNIFSFIKKMFAFDSFGEFLVIRYFPNLLVRSSTVQLISCYMLMFDTALESTVL